MAQQSILKLAVDVSDYEPKMRRAVKVIDDMRQALASQGRDFTAADEEMTQFLRDLAQMDTKVRGTRGSLMEMTRAVADMTVAYGGLSDSEKASPFGVELQNTINTVTERAGQLRDAMDDASASIQHAASDTRTFDQLAQGASVATSAFQVMQGAGKLLGVEMGDNVEVLARLQAAMSVTTGLTTIQNAVQKQSALMQGIMAVQAKAAAAAQALLAANTGKATAAQRLFNAVAKANPYMLLVTGITAVVGVLGLFGDSSDEATEKTNTLKNAIDSLNASMEFNIQLAEKMGASSEQVAGMRIEAAKAELQMAQQRKEQIGQVYRAIGKDATKNPEYMAAVDAEIDAAKRLAAAERDLAQIRVQRIRLNNTWDKGETEKEIQARINALKQERSEVKLGSEAYTDLSNKITQLEGQLKSTSPTPTRTGGGGGRGGNTGRATQAEVPVTVTESLTELQVLEDALQTVRNSMEGYSPMSDEWKEMNAEAERLTETINRMNGVVKEMTTGTSITNSRGMDEYISMLQEQLSQADFGSSIYSSIEAQLADTSTLKNLLQQSMKVGLGTSLFDAMDMNGESIWEKVLSPEGVEDADWDAIVAAINAKREELDLPPIVLDVKTGDISETAKKVKSGWNDAAEAIRSVGNALSQIEDPTARVLGIIAEAIASIALGFAKAINAEAGKGVWAWIAAAAAGTATMFSTIAAIKSATAGSYADGGIVPGNSYSGDRLTANVNSGELILSRAQQDSIAMQLQGSSTPEMHLTATITGEQIRLALNNNARRTGRGEYVTTRFT